MMLTAKGEETNRVQGFEVGADDYIVKPFSPREVVLRVVAILKRTQLAKPKKQENPDLIIFPHLEIDNQAHRVLSDGKPVNLTPKEYDLLLYLAQAPDQILAENNCLEKFGNMSFLVI